MKVTSAAQMREMDRRTIEDYGMPSIVLMENAALRVVEAIVERYGPLKGKRIAIICGKGNNGGDGFAVARHLSGRFGADISVWLAAEPASLAGDAAANYALAQKFDVPIQIVGNDLASLAAELQQGDLVVDAVLGTGIKGPVTGVYAGVIEAINRCRCPIVSVDVPSGLNADTGEVAGPCVRAKVTVTFALPKYGLVEFPGVDYVGKLLIADIGMPPRVMQADHVQTWLTDAAQVANWLPSRSEGRDSNKGIFGHVAIAAGSRGFAGASILAAEAAARTGAGLVTLAVPQSVQNVVMSRANPVVMTRGLPETDAGTFSRLAIEPLLHQKASADAIGPGLGGTHDEETRAFVREFVSSCPLPLVIDADALNILADEPDRGASIIRGRSGPTILTPHPGEMGRLLGSDAKAVQADRRTAVETAVSTYGCVVLLKGSRTLIAAPDGNLYINATGNSGMATGGMGDALTGIIAALLANGLAPPAAAAAGAYLHGLAGDIVASDHGGKAGLVATDLIDALPRAIGQCERAGL